MASRSGRNTGIILAVIGVLCLAVAAILTWVVVPKTARVPDNKTVTRQYSGTAKVVLNAAALQAGDLTGALIVNTPVTADRTVKVEDTSGNAAKVNDSRTLKAANGTTLGETSTTYAVNRQSLQDESSFPSSWKVTPHQGLTVSFPIGTNKHDYSGWINETRKTTPLKYSGQQTVSGVNTFVFKANSSPAPITDPATLATMPKELPVSALTALSSVLPIPSDDKAKLAQALPSLTQPVPLQYTFQVTSTYWVEPTTGEVVNNKREEVRKAGLQLPNGQVFAAVIPVFDVTTEFTSQSQGDAASAAKDDKKKIDFWGSTLPLILLIVGAVLLIVGIILAVLAGRRRSRPTGATPPGPPPATA